MLFEAQKAFPYPVLRDDIDDYVDGAFQASVSFIVSADCSKVSAAVKVLLSVPELTQLVEFGKVDYVVIFECKDTFYRKTVHSKSKEFDVNFEAHVLRGDVTASPFIVAIDNIDGFMCGLINPEYGGGPVAFSRGSVLAVDTPSKIYIDKDVFKPASSLFELVRNTNLLGSSWKLRTEEDRVQIEVSPKIKEKLDRFRNEKKNKAILINSIYFAAVMECVSLLKDYEGDEETALKWQRVMLKRCDNLGIHIKTEPLHEIAQKLLNDPFGRFETYLLNEEGK
jgi:hypothetical protein